MHSVLRWNRPCLSLQFVRSNWPYLLLQFDVCFDDIFRSTARRLQQLFDKYKISADMTYTISTSFNSLTTFVVTTSYNIALPIIKSTFEMNLTLDAKSVTLVKGCVPASQHRCSGLFVLTSITSCKIISSLAWFKLAKSWDLKANIRGCLLKWS